MKKLTDEAWIKAWKSELWKIEKLWRVEIETEAKTWTENWKAETEARKLV